MAKYFKFILSILIALVIVKVISPIFAIFGWIIFTIVFSGIVFWGINYIAEKYDIKWLK